MMVYVAGKYRTMEFVKIGVPFQMYLAVVAAFVLHFMDGGWTRIDCNLVCRSREK